MSRVGVGTTTPAARLDVLYSPGIVADSASSYFGFSSKVRAADTFNYTGVLYGGLIRGIIGGPQSGTVSAVAGAQTDVVNNSTTTIGNAYGNFSEVNNVTTGTITNAYGATADIVNAAGTISNGYGFYTGPIQATNKWSFYASDATALNYFAGNVGIGTTLLQVKNFRVIVRSYFCVPDGGESVQIIARFLKADHFNKKYHSQE